MHVAQSCTGGGSAIRFLFSLGLGFRYQKTSVQRPRVRFPAILRHGLATCQQSENSGLKSKFFIGELTPRNSGDKNTRPPVTGNRANHSLLNPKNIWISKNKRQSLKTPGKQSLPPGVRHVILNLRTSKNQLSKSKTDERKIRYHFLTCP